MKTWTAAGALGALFLGAAAGAASPEPGKEEGKKGYRLEPLKEAAPAEVSGKIKELLPGEGHRVLDPKGQPFADIWLRKSLPVAAPKDELGVKLGQIEEGTLLGVLRFHQKPSDFKGNDFPPGVYTIRYGVQPRDGDHLGVSESRDFVLLSPLKADTKPEPVPHKELVELSVQVSGTKHPTVLYLVKVSGEGKPPRVYQDESNEHWIFDGEIPASAEGKTAVRFGLILIGKAAEA